jgi:hypothetical protein
MAQAVIEAGAALTPINPARVMAASARQLLHMLN